MLLPLQGCRQRTRQATHNKYVLYRAKIRTASRLSEFAEILLGFPGYTMQTDSCIGRMYNTDGLPILRNNRVVPGSCSHYPKCMAAANQQPRQSPHIIIASDVACKPL